MPEIRAFTLLRKSDETGVSGTGRVLDGVIFHTGQVVICWRGDLIEGEVDKQKDKKGFSSLAIYPSWEAFQHIHIDSHPENRTEVVFGNDLGLNDRLRNSQSLDAAIDETE